MPVSSVIGLLWGDEGKGKIIDYLAAEADLVARFGGGHNAGHTIHLGRDRLVLHLIPSGILRPGVVNVIGNGVVVDPSHLVTEIDGLVERGVEIQLGRNLVVSERAHLILPLHRAIDQLSERLLGEHKLGTTGRGIGPAYADRAARSGLRVGDLIRPAALERDLRRLLAAKNPILRAFDEPELALDPLLAELHRLGERLRPAIQDTGALLRDAAREGRRILCEGAQGVLLDVDHGTYPFVTSSSASTGGIATGTGLPPQLLQQVTGVVKAYATRVGTGPFPTEQDNEYGNRLREAGREYGSTTGRPRRCGWFDAVAVRYACEVSGATALALTNLDVLAGIEQIPVAVAYELGGARTERFPAFDVEAARPVWREFAGFAGDLRGVRRFDDLPAAARTYVESIERLVQVPIRIVSVGPERDQVILR